MTVDSQVQSDIIQPLDASMQTSFIESPDNTSPKIEMVDTLTQTLMIQSADFAA